MRALFKPSAAPGLEMIECAEPNPGPNDVKIRVEKTGICGTDLHIESWDAWAASAAHYWSRILWSHRGVGLRRNFARSWCTGLG
jgi:threonine dehydrogenase-like Zn-dependent dehydrogenase